MIVSLAAVMLVTTPAERFERDLDCVLRRVSVTGRAEIVRGALGQPTEQGHLPLLDAMSRCEERYRYENYSFREGNAHWGGVVMAAMAVILEEGMGERLRQAGIATPMVDDWFAALPPDVRTTTRIATSVKDQLSAHLLAHGVSRETIDARSAELDHYFTSLVIHARIEAGLTPIP